MTVNASLFTGLNTAVRTGILTKYDSFAAAAGEVATSVGTAAFPATAAGWEANSGVTGFLPSHIWLCQETSGGRIYDSLNNVPLVQKLLFGSTLALGTATTLESGARTAVTLADNTEQALVATEWDVLNPSNGSVGWLVVFNAPDDPGTRSLANYGEAVTGTPVDTKGGIMTTLSGTGLLGASFSDGTTAQSGSLVGTDQCDGTWHAAGSFYNDTTGDCIQVHDSGTHTRSLSAFTWPDLVSYFAIGDGRFSAPGMDIACILGFTGAAAELSAANLATAVSAVHDDIIASI